MNRGFVPVQSRQELKSCAMPWAKHLKITTIKREHPSNVQALSHRGNQSIYEIEFSIRVLF